MAGSVNGADNLSVFEADAANFLLIFLLHWRPVRQDAPKPQ